MDKFYKIVGAALMIFASLAALSLISGAIAMWCWNYTAVEVFSAPRVGFWHAWAGMYLLALVGQNFKATLKTE